MRSVILVISCFLLVACQSDVAAPEVPARVPENTLPVPVESASPEPTPEKATQTAASERPVVRIPLTGPVADRNAEVSGMAWHGDALILLPQYPSRLSKQGDGAVFALDKQDIISFLDGAGESSLEPMPVPLDAPGLAQQIQGYEGYEAIVFDGDRVFATIEAGRGDSAIGYLVTGTMEPGLSALRIDPSTLIEIEPQADLSNMTDEALLVAGDKLVTIYEANGPAVNPDPVAHLFETTLVPVGTIPFPNIEYRITDATALDSANRFWAVNYFFPGDTKLKPGVDPLATNFGEGPTHAQYATVERLVEFQYDGEGISLTEAMPIQLALIDDDNSRNWEGIVRLDDRGFLLVTDKYPETILGFVARNLE